MDSVGKERKEPVTLIAVVDASVALKWQFEDEEITDAATALLRDFVGRRVELITSTLFTYEVISAINTAVNGKRIGEEAGHRAVVHLTSLGIELRGFEDLIGPTFYMARQYGLSPYDCAYMETCRWWLNFLTASLSSCPVWLRLNRPPSPRAGNVLMLTYKGESLAPKRSAWVPILGPCFWVFDSVKGLETKRMLFNHPWPRQRSKWNTAFSPLPEGQCSLVSLGNLVQVSPWIIEHEENCRRMSETNEECLRANP